MTEAMQTAVDEALASYSPADAQIAEWSANYMALEVTDLTDRDQLAAVHDARMIVKGARVEVEKTRKALKADSLAFGRRVDAEAKRIKGLMSPIEEHLQAEEDKVAAEKARIETFAEQARLENLRARMAKLREVGSAVLPEDIAEISDDAFGIILAAENSKHEEAQAEIKREADKREANLQLRERMAQLVALGSDASEEIVSAASPDQFTEMLERAIATRNADLKRLADEKRAREDAEVKLRAAQEKLDKDRRDLEEKQRVQREADEDAAQKVLDDQAETERARLAEERKPEAEQVIAFAARLFDLFEDIPEVWCADKIRLTINRAATEIRVLAQEVAS